MDAMKIAALAVLVAASAVAVMEAELAAARNLVRRIDAAVKKA